MPSQPNTPTPYKPYNETYKQTDKDNHVELQIKGQDGCEAVDFIIDGDGIWLDWADKQENGNG